MCTRQTCLQNGLGVVRVEVQDAPALLQVVDGIGAQSPVQVWELQAVADEECLHAHELCLRIAAGLVATLYAKGKLRARRDALSQGKQHRPTEQSCMTGFTSARGIHCNASHWRKQASS